VKILRRVLGVCAVVAGVVTLAVALFFLLTVVYHVYVDREGLPDIGPFARFEFPTVGRVTDVNGNPLIELAREHRMISSYDDIPPVIRNAILATEDKRFFDHNGLDYGSIPRVLMRIRIGTLLARLFRNPLDEEDSPAIFPQGGSTITQQLVRGYFLKGMTIGENSRTLRGNGWLTRFVSYVLGARNANMIARKAEEIRLSLWVEEDLRRRFGSKQRAKQEIFARYASFVYMGHGQYGFASAAEHYFGRPLSALTADDADTAAVLAGIPKSPRDNAPSAGNSARIIRRRNQTLALMAAEDFISQDHAAAAGRRSPPIATHPASPPPFQSSAVVAHVLDELRASYPGLGVEDLLEGRIQVESTVDARIQSSANEALTHGIERYEQRHSAARGLTQGSVIVLKNRDGSILAEVGGRQMYQGRSTSYADFNRVTKSFRQPGSAMKPIVYLAAFIDGHFTLQTPVPDDPISVPDGGLGVVKWISNYDGRFKGLIPVRLALAESRNAVAIWMTQQVGIQSVLRTARSLGIETRLQPFVTTALGASEVTLLELATAYRTLASGIQAKPYIIRQVAGASGVLLPLAAPAKRPVTLDKWSLALVQEGLRGVVRMPTGTGHALDSRAFPIPVMGKTGTTNDFRDALFVGSTYGIDGVTVAVRIGFDDNRSLGSAETGGRVALPVFRELMLKIYGGDILGKVPVFPDQMERRITRYLDDAVPRPAEAPVLAADLPARRVTELAELEWLRNHATMPAASLSMPLNVIKSSDPDPGR
jgi:penicillin-binding protein 1A